MAALVAVHLRAMIVPRPNLVKAFVSSHHVYCSVSRDFGTARKKLTVARKGIAVS